MNKLHALGMAMMLVLSSSLLSGSTRTIKFTNKTNAGVDDLHIDFSKGPVTVTANPFGSDRVATGTGPNQDRQHNFWGMTVAADGSVTLSFSSPIENLTIQQWYWTLGGTAINDGISKGKDGNPLHPGTDTFGTTLSFLDGPATGDGVILVAINGQDHDFTTTAGFTAAQTASAFDSFLDGLEDNGFALVNSVLLDSTTDQFEGNLLGDSSTELFVDLLHQDSTEPMVLTATIPEPGSSLLLGCGLLAVAAMAKRMRKARG